MTRTDSAQLLERLYRDAITALHPGRAVREALDGNFAFSNVQGGSLHVFAFGKAAAPMAEAALEWCARQQMPVRGGVCVTHDDFASGPGPLNVCVGDHPVPGTRSASAAASLDLYIALHVAHGDRVLVLLSGGTSALIGAPRDASRHAEYIATMRALLASGLSINQINTQRRQLSQWGGGRLGAALQRRGATVTVLVISDVVGDDLASIGSGPCVSDAEDNARAVAHHIVSNNRAARDAVISVAGARNLASTSFEDPLRGDANLCAAYITKTVLHHARHPTGAAQQPHLFCWGGEPTLTLPVDAPAGGRMQALALSVARGLHQAGHDALGITVLAAGTDGRDGATDAAGAVIDGQSWDSMQQLGQNPEQAIATFRSHQALGPIGALIPAFTSGTNVNDLVIALVC